MTDRAAIQVGDLVIVLRNCCDDNAIGSIVQVKAIREPSYACCTDCGAKSSEQVAVFDGKKTLWARPLSWLKRIPPAEESDRAFVYDVMTQPTKEPA